MSTSGLRGPNTSGGLHGPNAAAGLRGPNASGGRRGPNAATGARGFVVNVADLLHRPGARRRERLAARLEALSVVSTSVPAGAPVSVDAMLEWVSDGILASGTVEAPWEAECRRCLTPVRGVAEARFRELFEPSSREGESYPLRGDRIDLGPLAREALLLELPLAPVCRDDCKGLCPVCGAELNAGPCDCQRETRDPRWAALDVLREEPPRS